MNAQTKPEAMPKGQWAKPKSEPKIDDVDLKFRWQIATQKIADLAQENLWTKSEVARRAAIAIGTFSGWYDGTYNGRYDTTTLKIENFLASVVAADKAAAAIPVDPGFVQTRIARELFETFTYAQTLPTVSVVTIRAGIGKTCAAQQFQAVRPHVFHVTLSPSSRSPYMMMVAIAQVLGLSTASPIQIEADIIAALKRDGFNALLIIDEAQNLSEDCINQLRSFRDLAGCGLVLLGNDEATTPYATRDVKHASPQVSRRVGDRLSVMKSYDDDIQLFMDAWGIEDPEVRAVGAAIARKPGAIGALAETIKAGSMIARGMDRGLTDGDLRAAYQRRGGGAV